MLVYVHRVLGDVNRFMSFVYAVSFLSHARRTDDDRSASDLCTRRAGRAYISTLHTALNYDETTTASQRHQNIQ